MYVDGALGDDGAAFVSAPRKLGAVEHDSRALEERSQDAELRGGQIDPFAGRGHVVARLPWGPAIRKIGRHQVCFYFEPHPMWEKEHQLCRSVNLLSDGSVYASLEDHRSLLWRLTGW